MTETCRLPTEALMMPEYMPHGACWLWDGPLILLHAVGDLGTAFYYLPVIPGIALYIYHQGHQIGRAHV